MDVHDVAFERAQKFAFEHAHETGEHDQIHLRRLQRGDVIALGILIQLGAEFSGRDELRRNFPPARVRENSSAFDIAQDDAGFRWNFSRRDGGGDGGEVRAFAGAEHAQSKWLVHPA